MLFNCLVSIYECFPWQAPVEVLGRWGDHGRQSAHSQEDDIPAREISVLQITTSIHFHLCCDEFYLILELLGPIVLPRMENQLSMNNRTVEL